MDENLSILCNYVMLLIGEYLECGSSYFNKSFFDVLYKQLYEEEDFTTIHDRSTETFSIPNKRDSRVYSVVASDLSNL